MNILDNINIFKCIIIVIIKQHYKCVTIPNYECPLWSGNRDGSFDEEIVRNILKNT